MDAYIFSANNINEIDRKKILHKQLFNLIFIIICEGNYLLYLFYSYRFIISKINNNDCRLNNASTFLYKAIKLNPHLWSDINLFPIRVYKVVRDNVNSFVVFFSQVISLSNFINLVDGRLFSIFLTNYYY